MSMETGSTSLAPQISNVKSKGTSQEVSSSAKRSVGSTSAFSPQTNVDIKNSVADMAGILSKISQERQTNETSLSPQIQKILNQILEQSFSLESTLSNGLGSTLESQRFSVDQMLTLGRMLSQMAALSEQGGLKDIDESIQALLKNMKELFSEQNKNISEPALLHKFSFELINGQELDDVSPELLKFIKSNDNANQPGNANSQANSNNLATQQRLDTLIKSIITTSKPENTAAQKESGNAFSLQDKLQGRDFQTVRDQSVFSNNANTADGAKNILMRGNSSSRIFRPSEGNIPNTEVQSESTSNEAVKNQSGKTTMPADEFLKPGTSNAETAVRGKIQGTPEEQTAQKMNSTFSGALNENAGESISETNEVIQKQYMEAFKGSGKTEQNQKAFDMLQNNNEVQRNNEILLRNADEPVQQKTAQPEKLLIENTKETMQNLKSLASLLLKDAQLTEKDSALLMNFINQRRDFMSENDAKQLQLLLRLCQANVPAAVKQAAEQQNLPELTRLWAFMELCDLANLKEKNPQNLRQASKKVYDFAGMIKSSMTASESLQSRQGIRSMDFMIPLYLGENEKTPYPTYLHVYDEKEDDPKNPGEQKRETWVRLCLLTENIGAVDVTFRLYEKTNLDVRVLFSDPNTVEDFKQYIPEFKKSFDESPLQLADLSIAMAGAKVS